MTAARVSAEQHDAAHLCTDAGSYLRYVLSGVTDVPAYTATPCSQWSVSELLQHLGGSITVLTDLLCASVLPSRCRLPLEPVTVDPASIQHVERLLDLLATAVDGLRLAAICAVDDQQLSTTTVLQIGALELTVHAWDLACVAEPDPQIPLILSQPMLAISRRYIHPDTRAPLFAAARSAPPNSTPTHHLIAYLGRSRSTELVPNVRSIRPDA